MGLRSKTPIWRVIRLRLENQPADYAVPGYADAA